MRLLQLDGGPQFRHGVEQLLVHPPQVRDLCPKGGEFGIGSSAGQTHLNRWEFMGNAFEEGGVPSGFQATVLDPTLHNHTL